MERTLSKAIGICKFFTRAEEMELVRRKNAGDLAARDLLLASVIPLVVRQVSLATANTTEQDELIQLCLIAVARAVEKYDGTYRLTTYVRRPLSWTIKDGLVSQKRFRRFAAMPRDDEILVTVADRPTAAPAFDEDVVVLLPEALEILNLRMRQVIELMFFNGLGRHAVARRMRITVGQVSRLRHRALEKLKSFLQLRLKLAA